MSDPTRRARAAEFLPLLVASGVLAAGLATVTPEPVGVFWDDGVYLLSAILAASRPRWAVFSAAAGVQIAAAPLLNGANGTPRLEQVAQLPGGGVAFRVVLP